MINLTILKRHIFSSVLVSLVGLGDTNFNGNVIKSHHMAKSSIGNQKAPNEAFNTYSYKWYRDYVTQ